MDLIVTDFEATCWDKADYKHNEYAELVSLQEIIEIGCCVVDSYTCAISRRFSIIVKPVKYPILSDFCKNLTGITQDEVDCGLLFSEALHAWIGLFNPWEDIFCSWGYFDKNILEKNCKLFGDTYPFATPHVNIKTLVADELFDGRSAGVRTRCNELGITFIGNQHRGLDDAVNIVAIMDQMSRVCCESIQGILERLGKI